MRFLLSLSVLLLAASSPVHAADTVCTEAEWQQERSRCKRLSAERAAEQDHRFKVTIGWVVVPQGTVPRFDPSRTFRFNQGIRADTRYFADEYLLANGASYVPGADHVTLCCPYDTQVVQGPFQGQVGDTFQTWGRRELRSFTTGSVGLSTSLEYRMVGNLWGAFSFQQAPQTVAWVYEVGEFFQVRSIEPLPNRIASYLLVQSSRHRVEYEQEHKRDFYHFTGLLKYDLTRSNRHWSIMPQAGVEVFALREREYTIIREYDWLIFSGELHPQPWAHEPQLEHERTITEITWKTRIQPVVGLTMELYPAHKYNALGVVVDGRYYPGEHNPFTSLQGHVLELYPVNANVRSYSLSAYFILSF